MDSLRAALIAGAILFALPAFAGPDDPTEVQLASTPGGHVPHLPAGIDKRFDGQVATTVFLESREGRALLRTAVRAEDRQELTFGTYATFLAILGRQQNIALYYKLETLLADLIDALLAYRKEHGGDVTDTAGKSVNGLREITWITNKANDLLYSDHDLIDMARTAQEEPIRVITPEMRHALQEPHSGALTISAGAESKLVGLRFTEGDQIGRAMAKHLTVSRSLVGILVKDYVTARIGILPSPAGATEAEKLEYQLGFVSNTRRTVAMLGGINGWTKLALLSGLMAKVDRGAYAQLTAYSQSELNRFRWGGLSIEALIAAQKEIAKQRSLNIPEVVWVWQTEVLHVIRGLDRLFDREIDTEIDVLRVAQAELDDAERALEELKRKLKDLRENRWTNRLEIQRTLQAMYGQETKVFSRRAGRAKSINKLVDLCAKAMILSEREDLFVNVRQGRSGTKWIGVLDTHDAFNISEEKRAHRRAVLDEVLRSKLSEAVLRAVWSEEVRPLRHLWFGHESTRKVYKLIAKLDSELTGEVGGSTMKELEEIGNALDAQLKTLAKLGTLATTVGGGAVAFYPQLVKFAGWCSTSLTPLIQHVAK